MFRLAPSRLVVGLAFAALLLSGADGCSSDPDVEGAKLYIRSQEYDRALENLNRAIASDPENVEAHALKADVLRLQADAMTDPAQRRPLYQEMVTALNQASTLDPSNEALGQTRFAAWAKEMNTGGDALRSAGDDPAVAQRAVGAFENAVLIQVGSPGTELEFAL